MIPATWRGRATGWRRLASLQRSERVLGARAHAGAVKRAWAVEKSTSEQCSPAKNSCVNGRGELCAVLRARRAVGIGAERVRVACPRRLEMGVRRYAHVVAERAQICSIAKAVNAASAAFSNARANAPPK